MTDVSLSDVLSRWFSNRMESVHTMLPAIVQSYEGHGTRCATVLPATHWRSTSGAIVPYSPVAGVPVMFPSTSRFSMVFDLKKGDTGLLLVSEAALGNWLAGDGAATEPEDASRFTLNDAIFIPGLFPFSATPSIAGPDSGAYLEYEGTSIEFKKGGGLKIVGDLELEGAAKFTGEVMAMTALPSTTVRLSTHLHPTAVGPTTPPTPQPGV